MTSLYDIAAEYRAVAQKLEESEFDDQTIADTLDAMSGDLIKKCTNAGFFIRNLEAEVDAIKNAEAAMAHRRKSKEAKAEAIKSYLFGAMQGTGKTKFESPWFCLSIENNPPSVVIDAEGQIPEEYMREIPARFEPNKLLIKKVIAEGFQVPGAHVVSTQSLRIK